MSAAQVQRVFDGERALYDAIADSFPSGQEIIAQAFRDHVDEWETNTATADYAPDVYLQYQPSDEALSAFRIFQEDTNNC